MSHETSHRSNAPPEFWARKPQEHARKLAQSVRDILQGRTNNHYTVTFEAGDTEEEIMYESARPGVAVQWSTANAAAAAFARANDVWATSGFGKVTLHLGAGAIGGEAFTVVIIG